eukprot:3894699-Pleurochrysis_carterae.AAC.1
MVRWIPTRRLARAAVEQHADEAGVRALVHEDVACATREASTFNRGEAHASCCATHVLHPFESRIKKLAWPTDLSHAARRAHQRLLHRFFLYVEVRTRTRACVLASEGVCVRACI